MSKLFDLNGGVEISPLKETDGTYIVSTDANGNPVTSGFMTLSSLRNYFGTSGIPQLRTGNGTASNPAYSFNDDPDCGMYRASPHQIGFSAGGAARMTLSTTELVIWSSIDLRINKQITFNSPESATNTRNNLGLGTVATQTIVTGNEDTATTRIPTVGWVQANTVSLVEVPATPTSSGVAGQIAVDDNYAYFCTDTDTWIRVEKDNTWV